jgi:hypothetical protein
MAMAEQDLIKAKCRIPACEHVWVVAYLPMHISKVSKLLRRAACPKCGDLKPNMANK